MPRRRQGNPVLTAIGISSSLLSVAVGAVSVIARVTEDREPRPPDGENGENGEPANGFAQEPDPADIISNVVLRARTDQDAWDTIRTAWGPGALEDPTFFGDHASFGRHTRTMAGGGPHGQHVFRLHIHPRDLDKATGTRSRNEIKCDAGSPPALRFVSNDIGRFHWWFRMASDYQAVRDDILMQLHATGGGGNDPIVKLQADARDSPVQLEVTHEPNNTGGETTLDFVNFNSVRGQWLECECIAHFTNSGYLKFTVWDAQGTRVINVERTNIDMLYHDFLRFKCGIYRVRNRGKADFGDWADISIMKLRRIP